MAFTLQDCYTRRSVCIDKAVWVDGDGEGEWKVLNVGTRDLQPVHVHETRIHLVKVCQSENSSIDHFLWLMFRKAGPLYKYQ